MKQNTILALMLWWLVGPADLFALSPGAEVVVVYNSRMPESKAVADHYARRRQVPADQVFGFELSTNADFTREEFRVTLQRPLAKILSERKLWRLGVVKPSATDAKVGPELKPVESRIRYAVLCYGVPYRILRDPELKEEGTENWKPELRRNEAAVDSELALLPMLEQKPLLSGPLRNPVFLSTNSASINPTNGVLMVTRLDGPGAAVALALVDKAILAENEGLWGRAYFDLRNTTDPSYKSGDDSIRRCAEICRRLGFETVVDTNGNTFPASFPMSQIAVYIGWYDETVSGPLAQPKVEFMPGALAYHLHSFSAAALRSTNQNWAGPLLARGATVTLGCVDEPYLGGTPDMAVFTGRFLYEDFNFAEAAYAAQSVLSWQTTVIGDPLYRPTARKMDQLQKDLVASQSTNLEWLVLRVADLNLANGRSMLEVAAYLETADLRRKSAILTEKLAELYDTLGKPSSSEQLYLHALKLDCSPLQRVRIRLRLAEKFAASGKNPEALEQYRKILEEVPDYAGKPMVQQLIDRLHAQSP